MKKEIKTKEHILIRIVKTIGDICTVIIMFVLVSLILGAIFGNKKD